MQTTISNSIELLLLSRASYTRNLSHVDNELKSFWSCLKWMCINKSDARHAMIS
ncbi:hypothetical protein B296_00021293 [Ensete ventricosum]|uniref:Uncharacterized protein n=1 Tax=Ensete ventricosum TaxID=4639 RepID=A0A426YKL8_ENSVE|nr:hypothetical protein B296_00021293 [Ensete ventricosum]